MLHDEDCNRCAVAFAVRTAPVRTSMRRDFLPGEEHTL
jgi:hypothetical protein